MAFKPVFGTSCSAAHSLPSEGAKCFNCDKTNVSGGWFSDMKSITPYNLICAMILHLCKALHIWPALFLELLGNIENTTADVFVCSKSCAWKQVIQHEAYCSQNQTDPS